MKQKNGTINFRQNNSTFILFFVFIAFLIFSQNSFAWSTKPASNSGFHPELLPAAVCLPYARTGANSYRTPNDHTYSGYLNGGFFGDESYFGVGGDALFASGNVKYFVGPYVETYSTGGKNGYQVWSYQICYVSAVSYSYTTTQDQAAGCPADRPSGYILQRRTYEVWTDGSARNFGGWYNVADYCSAVVSYVGTQDQAAACPATRPSGYILQRRSYEVWTDGSVRNYSAWYNVADYCSAVFVRSAIDSITIACAPIDGQGRITSSGTFINYRNYEVWSDGSARNFGGYYNVADYCAVRGSETQNVACPATLPNGTITQSRTFEYYTTTAYSYGGQRFNYTAWTTIGNTCKSVYQSTETRYQTLACPATYPNGAGLKQSSTREIWSDGARTWSGWTTVEFACSKTVPDVKDNSRKTCNEGQVGYRITEWRRNHIEYISQSTLTPAQLAIENEKNATTWTEVEVANTCVTVPDAVVKSDVATRLLTCSAVYGGTESSYSGEVVETGKNVSTYSSSSKQTSTVFVSNSPKTYNSTCKSSVSDATIETTTKACATGYTGIITMSRYVKTDGNGVKTYPNGTAYVESSNTCVSNGKSSDDSAVVSNQIQSKGLLTNSTITTSSLMTKTDLDTFVKTLDKSTLKADGSYKLHLIVDDISIGKYNKANVTKTINAFKNTTGEDPIITFPKSLDKYIGYGGITAQNYKNKVFKSAILNGNTVTVTYSELAKGIKVGDITTFKVTVY